MKYYVIQSSNENVSIVSEWSDLNSAIVAYHDRCNILWNAKDVVTGIVTLVDSNLLTVGMYRETISHPQENTTEDVQ
jgi:hypothetical protein